MPPELEATLEQAIYDYVYEQFGASEADDPSWGIRGLAEYLAEAVRDKHYTGKHKMPDNTEE